MFLAIQYDTTLVLVWFDLEDPVQHVKLVTLGEDFADAVAFSKGRRTASLSTVPLFVA